MKLDILWPSPTAKTTNVPWHLRMPWSGLTSKTCRFAKHAERKCSPIDGLPSESTMRRHQ